MRRRRRSVPPFNALSLWTDFAARSAEMLFASAEVISRRVQRIAVVGAAPDAADRRELQRMVDEKMSASSESMQAIILGSGTLLTDSFLRICAEMGQHAFSICSGIGRTPAKAMRDSQRSMARWGELNGSAANAAAKLAGDALEPFHARATANVKRLRKH